ncbi:MAG: S4 domain-containing protein, partial [Burkholderiaceae bacterium]
LGAAEYLAKGLAMMRAVRGSGTRWLRGARSLRITGDDRVQALQAEAKGGRNPRDIKVDLALELVERFHSRSAALAALAHFEARFKQGEAPSDLTLIRLGAGPLGVVQVLKQAGLVPSNAEAFRNIEQGGVRVDGSRVEDRGLSLQAGQYVVQVGKRRFAKVEIE